MVRAPRTSCSGPSRDLRLRNVHVVRSPLSFVFKRFIAFSILSFLVSPAATSALPLTSVSAGGDVAAVWRLNISARQLFEFRVEGYFLENTTANGISFWLMHNGSLIDSVAGLFTMTGIQLNARSSLVPGRGIAINQNPGCIILFSNPCPYSFGYSGYLEPGTWTVVATVGSNGSPHAVMNLRTDAPSELWQGSSFLHLGRDFSAPLNVGVVDAPLFASAKVLLNGRLDLPVRGCLFGAFSGSVYAGTLSMEYENRETGDHGSGRTSYAFPCAKPGTYRFAVNEVDAGQFDVARHDDNLFLLGADIDPALLR